MNLGVDSKSIKWYDGIASQEHKKIGVDNSTTVC